MPTQRNAIRKRMSVVCLLPIYLYVTKSAATDTPVSEAARMA